MGLFAIIAELFGTRAVPPPPGFAVGAAADDQPEMQAHDFDVADGGVTAGVRLAMVYQDASGAISRRVIKVMSVKCRSDLHYLYGWCELRGALRSFRVDRIVEVADIRTGEVPDDVHAYLAPLLSMAGANGPRRPRRDPAEWLIAESANGLAVLLYFANADGELHPAERDVLWSYLNWQKKRCSIRARIARGPLDVWMRTVVPDTEQFASALERLLDSEAVHAQYILDLIPKIIQADGKQDDEELRRYQQLVEILGNRVSVH